MCIYETTIVYWGDIGDDGKEHGNLYIYIIGVYWGYIEIMESQMETKNGSYYIYIYVSVQGALVENGSNQEVKNHAALVKEPFEEAFDGPKRMQPWFSHNTKKVLKFSKK